MSKIYTVEAYRIYPEGPDTDILAVYESRRQAEKHLCRLLAVLGPDHGFEYLQVGEFEVRKAIPLRDDIAYTARMENFADYKVMENLA